MAEFIEKNEVKTTNLEQYWVIKIGFTEKSEADEFHKWMMLEGNDLYDKWWNNKSGKGIA